MENNTNNTSYFNTTTGRYLGISDGYFLYGNNPNWVYSYCHSCWVKEIQKILPSLGLENKENQKTISDLKNNINELKNKIQTKENEIIKLQNENKKLENELIKLKEQGNNLVSAPINTINIDNNFEFILSQSFIDLKIEKIKNLLKSSEINEISDLEKLFSSDNIYSKTIEECKNACRAKLIETIKEVIEKISVNIEQKNSNINSVSLIYDEIKRKLNVKEIPENISNESIIPLKNHIDELKKKMGKMNEIKEEINKIYLKLLE